MTLHNILTKWHWLVASRKVVKWRDCLTGCILVQKTMRKVSGSGKGLRYNFGKETGRAVSSLMDSCLINVSLRD